MAGTERSKRLHVMLTEEEHAMAVAMAEQQGLGISGWARQLIRDAARRNLPPDAVKKRVAKKKRAAKKKRKATKR